MNVRHPMCVLTFIFCQKYFYNKIDLRLTYFHVTSYFNYIVCMIVLNGHFWSIRSSVWRYKIFVVYYFWFILTLFHLRGIDSFLSSPQNNANLHLVMFFSPHL